MTNRYFAKIEKGLKKENVVNGPVHSSSEGDYEVGRIEWYNSKNGYIRVKLHQPVYYKHLLNHGIEQKNIIFNKS